VNERSGRRCAVVYNPIKVSDDLRDAVARRAGEAGWSDPTWLGTPADNPGQAVTADVVSASPDRVIAVGGDGTVQIVADRLRNRGSRWQWCRLAPETCWPATWRFHCLDLRHCRSRSASIPETLI
jgi:hypothetical protein